MDQANTIPTLLSAYIFLPLLLSLLLQSVITWILIVSYYSHLPSLSLPCYEPPFLSVDGQSVHLPAMQKMTNLVPILNLGLPNLRYLLHSTYR